MNPNHTRTEPSFSDQAEAPAGRQRVIDRPQADDENSPPNKPDRQPRKPSPRQLARRRIGAVALTISLGAGTIVWAGPKVVEAFREQPYDVSDRTPTETEICTIRRTGGQALLLVAAEFTDDPSSRRAAASRINQATKDQDDDRFGVCYSPDTNSSRVLTDEAVEGLPAPRLVNWGDFPGRTSQPDR